MNITLESAILVLFHPKLNQLQLYGWNNYDYWLGEPWILWSTLEICLEKGWEVIGEL